MLRPSICHAIRTGRVLKVTYKGTARLIEPSVYGLDADGGELLRGFQLSPPPTDWRTLRLDKSTRLALMGTRYDGVRADPTWEPDVMREIYCQRQ